MRLPSADVVLKKKKKRKVLLKIDGLAVLWLDVQNVKLSAHSWESAQHQSEEETAKQSPRRP